MVRVTKANPYLVLPNRGLINATEVLEHVIDPSEVIRKFHGALTAKGIYTFSDFPMKPKTLGGGHLRSAAAKREKSIKILNKYFEPLWSDPSLGYTYQKL